MRKLKLAYLLAFAPVLMGANQDEYASTVNGLTVTSALPECGKEEFLTYSAGGLICASLSAGGAGFGGPSDCKGKGQILTYSMTGEIGSWTCIDKGKESLSSSDITTINTKYQELVNMETLIKNLEMGMRTPAAKYCGGTAVTNGQITAPGSLIGLPAAAKLCEGIPACGTGARMCSVYDMYHSVAVGKITVTDTLGESWVYMANWQQFDSTADEPTSGLNDNCGTYTYPTGDRKWKGTWVSYLDSNLGKRSLKFLTGAAVNCAATRPIACCK